MIARIRKSMEEKDQGFTLIELLVVMVIIGILSAIAVPVFLNQRTKAYDTAAKSDVANIGREVATYLVDGDVSTAPVLTVTANTATNGSWSLKVATTEVDKGTVSKNVGAAPHQSKIVDATTWCVAVKSQSGSIFSYTQTGPTSGDCPA